MKPFKAYLQVGVVVLGLIQSLSYVLGISNLRGFAMVTAASPLPLVFSHFRGLETFSSHFQVRIWEPSGKLSQFSLSPEVYGKFEGPYARRNVYGAVAAFGMKMTEPREVQLVKNVLRFGFCGTAPLAKSFGYNFQVQKAEIKVENNVAASPQVGTLGIECQN